MASIPLFRNLSPQKVLRNSQPRLFAAAITVGMSMTLKKNTIIIASALFVVLVLSLVFYFLNSYPRVSRVFFFPGGKEVTVMGGERHLVPRHKTMEANVAEYVNEWLLGPVGLENLRLFPDKTHLRSALYRDDALYLDFSLDLLLLQETVPLSFQEILDETKKGISFNFPKIKTIFFFIEGEPVPNVIHSFSGESDRIEAENRP